MDTPYPNDILPSMSWQEKEAHWAKVWFENLARFHRVKESATWAYTNDDVIAFLKSKVDAGVPTWKRIKIVEGLIIHRNVVRRSHNPPLEKLRHRLQQRLFEEQDRKQEAPIEDVVGKIDPREPDVIQAFRRSMRVQGKAFNTEKAYVQKVRAFPKEDGWCVLIG